MKIRLFQVDAFADTIFQGNPAAVCPLENWLDDHVLQNIAIENNVAETAFFVKQANGSYKLRWFTPEIEMDLCGHATLASAYVLFERLGYPQNVIKFETHSGELRVTKEEDKYVLDFPSRPPVKAALPEIIKSGLNIQPLEVWKARDYLLIYGSELDIQNIEPNIEILNQINIDPGGIIVSARSLTEGVDFVSRFFTPQAVIFEDPVTGSAHCTLIPFWAERLNKQSLNAVQLSSRRGELFCELNQNRVLIKGKAVLFLEGTITL